MLGQSKLHMETLFAAVFLLLMIMTAVSWSAYDVPGVITQSVLHPLPHLSQPPYEIGTIMIPSLQMKKPGAMRR